MTFRFLSVFPVLLFPALPMISAAQTPRGSAISAATTPVPRAVDAALSMSQHTGGNRIEVVVNGRPILKSEVDDKMRSSVMELRSRVNSAAEFEEGLKKLRDNVLESCIEQELILNEFQPYAATFNSKVEAHADEMIKKQWVEGAFKGDWKKFRTELEESGMGWKKFRDQQKKTVIMEMMRGQFARPESEYVTNEERAQWFKKHEMIFREGVKLKFWSLTIPAEIPGEKTAAEQQALAKEVRARLVNGADFASLARTHSTDSKRDAGGSWGWVDRKDLADVFWPVVSKLPTGKISEIIPIAGSLYIFWVEGRSGGTLRPQAEIDLAVERGVKSEKRQKANDEWVAKLRKKATITYPK
jgi:peptidyl-prolyl cis-trans isomerase SurA